MSNKQDVFLETTQVWDVSELYSTDVTSPEFKELLVRMYRNIGYMATAINERDIGSYDVLEGYSGQLFFPNPAYDSSTETVPHRRNVSRKVLNYGALHNAAGFNQQAHGITVGGNTKFTRIYGTANDSANNDYLPMPYASAVAADIIELSVDATKVTIMVGKNRSMFDTCYVVLEFIQS